MAKEKENSKNLIVETALRLFAHEGYEKTSIRKISSEAGISLGLMYNYFSGKEDLLRHIFLMSLKDIEASFQGQEEGRDPNESMEILIRNIFTIIPAHREFWKLFYSLRIQPFVLASMKEEIENMSVMLYSKFEKHFREVGSKDPEAEARIFIAVIDGVSVQYVIDPEKFPLESTVDLLIEKYGRKKSDS